MNISLKIPVCNIIACEDILIKEDGKVYMYNPFTAISGKSIKRFYTYSIIQGIPNGQVTFRIQIISPRERIVKETGDNTVLVEENIIRVKTEWKNILFDERGEHTFTVLLKCNNEYETSGVSYMLVL